MSKKTILSLWIGIVAVSSGVVVMHAPGVSAGEPPVKMLRGQVVDAALYLRGAASYDVPIETLQHKPVETEPFLGLLEEKTDTLYLFLPGRLIASSNSVLPTGYLGQYVSVKGPIYSRGGLQGVVPRAIKRLTPPKNNEDLLPSGVGLVEHFGGSLEGFAPAESSLDAGQKPPVWWTNAMQGEIVDPLRYLLNKQHGPHELESITEAANQGIPLAFLEQREEEATLYLFLATEPGEDPNILVHPFIGHPIEVEGMIRERGGSKGIVATVVTELDTNTALP
ncbi:MAG: hypothetical protein HYY57_03670 [Candidatus Omnitrophica bacterium]|nr:hypothetical protein [Candidatus Omnitrophota bacterium]